MGMLLDELNMYKSLLKGKSRKYYEQVISDSSSIDVVSITEVLTPDQIAFVKKFINPKPKECYRNAALLSSYLPDVKYVEGRMLCAKIIGIDHAWNKVGDKYIDITMELVLKKNPSEEEYLRIGEYEFKDIEPIIMENQCYGNIYNHFYFNKNRKS